MSAIAIVGRRVDALTLGFRVELRADVVTELRARHEVAREHGKTSVTVGALRGELKFSRQSSQWNIGAPDVRVRIDLRAAGGFETAAGIREPGWTVEVVWRAQALAELPDVGHAVRAARAMVDTLGEVKEERVRRLDLCADVAGWAVAVKDVRRLVRRPRAKVVEHGRELAAADADASPTVHRRRAITGISVCPGGALMARMYDKREESKHVPERARAEEERWKAEGWGKGELVDAPVTRVEFQIRGEALHEFGARDPRHVIDRETGADVGPLERYVDRMWQKCLEWIRLVRPDGSRLTRCPDDARWSLLKTVTFMPGAPKSLAFRRRVRGGATVDQTLGCVLSVLGARKLLNEKDERTPIGKTDAEVSARVQADVLGLFAEAGRACAWELLQKWGPAKASVHVAVVNNATEARFGSREEAGQCVAA